MNIIKSILIVSSIIFLDQFTKYIAKLYLPISYNQGISLGLLNHFPFLSYVSSVVILAIIAGVLFFKKPKKNGLINYFSLLLLLSGGISNTIDRVLTKGAVVDWIRIWSLPVFNLADVATTIGVILIIYNIVIARSE